MNHGSVAQGEWRTLRVGPRGRRPPLPFVTFGNPCYGTPGALCGRKGDLRYKVNAMISFYKLSGAGLHAWLRPTSQQGGKIEKELGRRGQETY